MKNEKLAKCIIGVAGCLAIGVACWVTKSGTPLWALLLLSAVLSVV